MDVIRYLIVDDIEANYINLKEELLPFSNLLEVKRDDSPTGDNRCIDAEDGLNAILKYNPDLVFLDIQMPGDSGFDLLDNLKNPPAIIFVTGFMEYASRYAKGGYGQKSSGFLEKPVSKDDLKPAIDQVLKDLESKTLKDRLIEQKAQLGYISLKCVRSNSIESVRIEHIAFIKKESADGSESFGKGYIRYHLINGKQIVTAGSIKQTLKDFEQYGFFSPDQSFAVNPQNIIKYEKNSHLLELNGIEERVKVSYRNRSKVNKLMAQL